MTRSITAVRRSYAKLVAAAGAMTLSAGAFAQGTPIDTILDSVSLDGLAVKLTALAVIVVGIALVFKGPALAKRIISKV